MRYPAPFLGQHTDEVLREFGFSAARIAHCACKGAFAESAPEPGHAAVEANP